METEPQAHTQVQQFKTRRDISLVVSPEEWEVLAPQWAPPSQRPHNFGLWKQVGLWLSEMEAGVPGSSS